LRLQRRLVLMMTPSSMTLSEETAIPSRCLRLHRVVWAPTDSTTLGEELASHFPKLITLSSTMGLVETTILSRRLHRVERELTDLMTLTTLEEEQAIHSPPPLHQPQQQQQQHRRENLVKVVISVLRTMEALLRLVSLIMQTRWAPSTTHGMTMRSAWRNHLARQPAPWRRGVTRLQLRLLTLRSQLRKLR
jgi:hypothetical protein